MYQERSETMKNIESTVVELGAIFQQLAHMVKEQEEMVQRSVQGLLFRGQSHGDGAGDGAEVSLGGQFRGQS